MKLTFLIGILAVAASSALAQRAIDSNNKYSWQENCGWMDWHDAGAIAGAAGVRVRNTYLAGYIWCENIGWITLGNAPPANGSSYANTTGDNFGVNMNSTTGAFTGMAWGENVGWINFAGGSLATPSQAARLDGASGRFRGYVWSENIGWINLDDATRFVALRCPADFDDGSGTGTPDGGVTIDDLLFYLLIYGRGEPLGDVDDGSGTGIPDGGVTIDDLLYFLTRYADGC